MKIMSINNETKDFSLTKIKKECFGRIKRKYQSPKKIIGLWEAMSLTK